MTLHELLNTLRILKSIDHAEVEEFLDWESWLKLQREPLKFFRFADADTQARLWEIIEARQPRGKVAVAAE
jgi:hypothetical protein